MGSDPHRRLIDSIGDSPIATVVSNPRSIDNPLEAANPAFCALTGYSESEVVGRNCRFLAGDRDKALAAWNRIRIPAVDLIRIDGLRRTRYAPVAAAMALPSGTVLTPERLDLARRRVAALPTVRRSAVEYRPVPSDRAEVRAAVVERPLFLDSWPGAGHEALGALVREEIRLGLASPTGGGELLSGRWRWDPARPRAGIALEVPARWGLPGVLRVEGMWGRTRIRVGDGSSDPVVEERRAGSLDYTAWVTSRFRSVAGLGFERWDTRGTQVMTRARAELLVTDELTVGVAGELALGPGRAPSFTTTRLFGGWHAPASSGRTVWTARAGLDLASSAAPLTMLPLAGTNPDEMIPLRAHRLVDHGAIAGTNLGRTILHGGVAADRPLRQLGVLSLGVGAFADAAGVFASPGPRHNAFYLDAGGGLRLGLGRNGGDYPTLRIDVARDLMDGGTVVSVGIHRGVLSSRF